jgi:SPP1 gp7 family putative phage head morphogenesis protein
MSDYTDKEEQDFIESLYNEADKQIKEVYKEQKNNRDELLKQLANIMLTYTILNDLMKLSKADKKKEYNRLSKIVVVGTQAQGVTQNKVIKEILNSAVNKTFNFYSYNANLKDVREIIGSNFKGAHFSDRVWGHNNDVAKLLHKQTQDFLNGKINVNQIKRNIEKSYNTSAYNVQRLVETEISHVESLAFKRFCKETGVERVLRNEEMDSRTCSICAGVNGKVYDLDDAPDNLHPRCRGYNTVL